ARRWRKGTDGRRGRGPRPCRRRLGGVAIGRTYRPIGGRGQRETHPLGHHGFRRSDEPRGTLRTIGLVGNTLLTITLSSFLGNRCRMRPFLDEPREELETWFRDREQAAMRARQIRRWLLSGRAESFDQMTDLPQDLRTTLGAEFVLFGTQIASHLASRDGTHKLLLRLPDNQLVECVLIQEDARRTACISTQVGCGMGCVFCASGIGGVVRNLTVGEILEQLMRLRNLLPPEESLNHIVVMGMGEPL